MSDEKDELRRYAYITTFSGAHFRFDEPGPFILKDIVHSLACTVRFRGHTIVPYYVAQHCVLVAREMENCGESKDAVVAGLMHDAHEAYVGDVPSPLKWHCPEFAAVERRVENALRVALTPSVDSLIYDLVKSYDRVLLHREACSLMLPVPEWALSDGQAVTAWDSFRARLEFRLMAERLGIR